MHRRNLLKAAGAGTLGVAALAAPAAAAPANVGTERNLSEFAGATDDDRLTAFMSYAAAQTMHGITAVLDEARLYTFAVKRTLYDGFSIRGAHRPQDQGRSSMPIGNRVKLSTPGGWFALGKSSTFGCSWQNLSLDGGASQRLVEGHASNVIWTSVWRDISAQNIGSILGSSTVKLLNTACDIDGWWNVNNIQDCAFNLGGSDSNIKPTKMLLDDGGLLPATAYMFRFSSQSKGVHSGFYCTAEGQSGFLIAGGSGVFSGNIVEGRNSGSPCNGALIRMTSGTWLFRDNFLNYAMANPSATGRNDAGVLHVAGGNVVVDGVHYDKATSVAATVPLVYVGAGKARISNVVASFKPVVRQAVAGLIEADNSVTVVTG